MATIYKIWNDINDMLYIGKTLLDVQIRWREHIHSARRPHPTMHIHRAMKKYGIEHFHIEVIEETDSPDEREQYWICYYDTYRKGYNSTLGGEGAPKFDYNQAAFLYEACADLQVVADTLGCSYQHAGRMLHSYPCKTSGSQTMKNRYGKPVNMYSPDGDFVRNFESLRAAASFVAPHIIPDNAVSSIRAACNGGQKTAYGYQWKFAGVSSRTTRCGSRAITAYDGQGNTVYTFESIGAAAKHLQANGFPKARKSAISSSANGLMPTAYGFVWRFTDPEDTAGSLAYQTSHEIIMNDVSGQALRKFASATSAAEYLAQNGSTDATLLTIAQRIRSACRGDAATAYGYIWTYTNAPVN